MNRCWFSPWQVCTIKIRTKIRNPVTSMMNVRGFYLREYLVLFFLLKCQWKLVLTLTVTFWHRRIKWTKSFVATNCYAASSTHWRHHFHNNEREKRKRKKKPKQTKSLETIAIIIKWQILIGCALLAQDCLLTFVKLLKTLAVYQWGPFIVLHFQA